jgi:hypothetical protein
MGRKSKKKTCKTRGCSNANISSGLCAKCTIAKKRYGSVHGKQIITKKCRTCRKKFKTKRDSAEFCPDRKCYRDDPENKVKQAVHHKTFLERKEE